MSHSIGIIGAGLLGRMLAVAFHRKGWRVSVFDRQTRDQQHHPGRLATGLIAPYVELSAETQAITLLGEYATEQWPTWTESLAAPTLLKENGLLAVAHPRDAGELESLRQRIADLAVHDDLMTECAAADIAQLEPELDGRFQRALFFPLEQHLDPCALLHTLGATIEEAGITWREGCDVNGITARTVTCSAGGTEHFDWVIDARGLGASASIHGLHAIRSERVRVHAPSVNLSRPVRLMHPRHAIYVVPHDERHYVISGIDTPGGTDDPVTVRSALELLSAAYTIHPGFGDAQVVESGVVMLPAMPGGLPRITPHQGLLTINGLSRHAWLVIPALVDIAVTFIDTGDTHPMAEGIMEEWTL